MRPYEVWSDRTLQLMARNMRRWRAQSRNSTLRPMGEVNGANLNDFGHADYRRHMTRMCRELKRRGVKL